MATILILPASVSREIEKLCRSFLWNGTSGVKARSLVSWREVCNETRAGGLGIRNLALWNIDAIIKNIWRLLVKAESLWVI